MANNTINLTYTVFGKDRAAPFRAGIAIEGVEVKVFVQDGVNSTFNATVRTDAGGNAYFTVPANNVGFSARADFSKAEYTKGEVTYRLRASKAFRVYLYRTNGIAVTFKVKDLITNVKIKDAVIVGTSAGCPTVSGTTDSSNGEVILFLIKNKTYSFTIGKNGYYDTTVSVVVGTSSATPTTFYLKPK